MFALHQSEVAAVLLAIGSAALLAGGGCNDGATSPRPGSDTTVLAEQRRGGAQLPEGAVCRRRATCNDWRGCVLAVPAAGRIVQACCERANNGDGYRVADSENTRATLIRTEVCPEGAVRTCYEALDDGACGGPFLPRAPGYRCQLTGAGCERLEDPGGS